MLRGLKAFFKIITTQGLSPKVILVRTAKEKRMSNLQGLQAAPGSQLLWVIPEAGVDFHQVVVLSPDALVSGSSSVLPWTTPLVCQIVSSEDH